MKRLALASLFIITTVSAQHGSEYDCMLISLPRSGSSFLAAEIARNNSAVKYNSEQLTRQWGGRYFSQFGQAPKVKGLYNQRFNRTDLNFTKEVFLPLYMDVLQQKFTIFCLYRHRKYTFPAKQEGYFLDMFDYFVKGSCPNATVKSIRDYMVETAKNSVEKQCAIHIVMNYFMFKNAQQYGMHIIEYDKLMTLKGEELFDYLENNIPQQLFSEQLSAAIENNRFQDGDFLVERVNAYNDLGVEEYCKQLIAFIKLQDADMVHWSFFD